jgi:hypothetical protein
MNSNERNTFSSFGTQLEKHLTKAFEKYPFADRFDASGEEVTPADALAKLAKRGGNNTHRHV